MPVNKKSTKSKETKNVQGFFEDRGAKAATVKESVGPLLVPSIALPITLELTGTEKKNLQQLIEEDYKPTTLDETRLHQDLEELTSITRQIKCITAQSVLLHGERIQQAQKLLSRYKEGAFTRWLLSTYGNRQTPYCMLRYYEFYTSAPKQTQPTIEAAPKKAVYLLASREGDKEKKLALLREHKTSSQAELLLLIRSEFPIEENDRRKPLPSSTIENIGKMCKRLEDQAKNLSKDDRKSIRTIVQRLNKLCSSSYDV